MATYYHAIVQGPWLWPALFRPKRDKINEKTGEPIPSKYKKPDGTNANIPENNPVGKLLGAPGGVFRKVTSAWTSDKDRLTELEGPPKAAVNAIKSWMGSKPVMVWFHADGCEINDKHLHIITHDVPPKQAADAMFDTVVDANKTYAYKAMRGKVNKAGGKIKLQAVISLVGLQSYLCKPGHIFFGANKKYMLKHYGVEVWMKINNGTMQLEEMMEAHVNPEPMTAMPGEDNVEEDADDLDTLCGVKRAATTSDDEDIFGDGPAKRAKVDVFDGPDDEEDVACLPSSKVTKQGKQSLAHKSTQKLVELIQEFGFESTTQVLEYMVHTDSSLSAIVYSLHFSRWFATAREVVTAMNKPQCLSDMYSCVRVPLTIGAHDAASLLRDWCDEQGIDIMLLVSRLYCVMAKCDPKMNSLALIGASNAGKSFWISSLIPSVGDAVGTVTKSGTFMWQNCVDKQVIVMEEALLSPELMETFKVIAGGQPTMVDIKMKAPAKVNRTPLLIASNHSLWKYQPEAQNTLRNRVYVYDNLATSEVLGSLQGALTIDPQLWHFAFSYCARYHSVMADIANGDCDPPSYHEMIATFPGGGEACPEADDVAFIAPS